MILQYKCWSLELVIIIYVYGTYTIHRCQNQDETVFHIVSFIIIVTLNSTGGIQTQLQEIDAPSSELVTWLEPSHWKMSP